MSSKGSTLSGLSGRAWNSVAKASLPQSVQWFSRDTEVMAKLPEKRSRQYIYDLLQKVKFNICQLEAIVERRGGMVDFTCSCKEAAQLLVKLLSPLKEVGFVRLFDPEFTDIKVHWVPHRFPNSEMIKTIEERHGKVYFTKALQDKNGLYDGRRIYKLRTADLKAKPIPRYVRKEGLLMMVEYSGQPPQCFFCRQFGHIRSECPNMVTNPAPLTQEVEQEEGMEVQPIMGNDASDVTTTQLRRDSLEAAEVACGVPAPPVQERTSSVTNRSAERQCELSADNAEILLKDSATDRQPANEDHDVDKNKDKCIQYVSTSTTTDDVFHDDQQRSMFSTDSDESDGDNNETKGMGPKRALSSDSSARSTAPNKRELIEEYVTCNCDKNVEAPVYPGQTTLCECGLLHVKCRCNFIFATKGTGPAHCPKCAQLVPRIRHDVTL